MTEPADYRQQEEIEEFQQYLIDTGVWFKYINNDFENTFLGVRDDGFHDIEED